MSPYRDQDFGLGVRGVVSGVPVEEQGADWATWDAAREVEDAAFPTGHTCWWAERLGQFVGEADCAACKREAS